MAVELNAGEQPLAPTQVSGLFELHPVLPLIRLILGCITL